MVSKSKESREGQKVYWTNKMNQRLSDLAEKGLEPSKISKDVTVRKIRAKLRETENRLKTIAGLENKVKEMAKIKSEKKAAPEKVKGKKKKEAEKTPEMSKRQQKKKKKTDKKSKA